jgi:hypothetical protein
VASSSPDSMPDLTYGGNLLTSISDGLDAANGDLVPSAEGSPLPFHHGAQAQEVGPALQSRSSSKTLGDEAKEPNLIDETDAQLSPVEDRNGQLGEGSLFVGESYLDVVDLTDQDTKTNRTSRSPDEAMRAINAHVGASSRSARSAGSSASTESNLLLSPTRYSDIVPRSVSGNATTASSRLSSVMGGGEHSWNFGSEKGKRPHDGSDDDSESGSSSSNKRIRDEGRRGSREDPIEL